MDKETLIKKWLNNELTQAEQEAFDALHDADLYKEIIDEAKRFKGSEHVNALPFESLENALSRPTKTSTKWLRPLVSVAAIFLIGFALFTLVLKDNSTTVRTTLAMNESITLPDNSKVALNELSEISYNAKTWNDSRELTLAGEAYFDVEKGNQFTVVTPIGQVRVLGTEFNVLSRDSIFEVVCYEGLVEVTYNNKSIELPKGAKFSFKNGGTLNSNIIVSQPFWLTNMSVFEAIPIEQVILELQNIYEIQVDYNSSKTLNFTGAFAHNDLENALKSITQPLGLTYTLDTNKMVIIRHVEN